MGNEAKKSDLAYASFAARMLADFDAEVAFVAGFEAIKARKAAKIASIELSTVRA